MKKPEYPKLRVFLGYLSMLALAVIASIHIFGLITRIVAEEKRDDLAKEKSTIITNILLLLYESETYNTPFIYEGEEEFVHFNQALDKVFGQLQKLKSYASNSVKWEKMNNLEALLEQKRENTRFLQQTWQEIGRLYSKRIDAGIQMRKDISRELALQSQEHIQTDTLLVQRQKKGFFKRLVEAFVPEKTNSAIHINSYREQQTDSLIHEYDPSEAIAYILRKIQSDIDEEYAVLHAELNQRVIRLRDNNNVIGIRINQLLSEIEDEEIASAQEQEIIKDKIVRNASKDLAVISFISLLITLLFIFLIFRDISRSEYYRKQLEDAKQLAEDLLRSREKFMLMISHDIRAPLSSIMGYIELMKNRREENRERYFGNISTLSGHILVLVNDLLDFHRLESGQIVIRPIPFSAPVLFEEIYTGFRPLAKDKELTFHRDIQFPAQPTVYIGDPVRIRQAIGNLLSNAIKFTPRGGSVTLSAGVLPEPSGAAGLLISVKDKGRGIAESEQEIIFKEFARLGGTENIEGFGLGLSITCKLVALMGGSISLNSKVNEGSEFVVSLPLPLSDAELQPAGSPRENFLPFRAVNCLVIDDDALQLKLMEEMLRRLQVNVISLSDSGDVMSLLQAASFDIILTDIQMPGLDGYALLRRIRFSGIRGADSIPVIALSASLSEAKEHYMEAGFTHFLSKPVSEAHLLLLFNELFSADKLSGGGTPDIAALTAFAGDDKEAAQAILQTFSEETRRSIALLQEALESGNHTLASKVSHKLIPVFSMLEARHPVRQLRILEENAASLSEQEWKQTLQEVISRITFIVEQTGRGGFVE